MTFPLDTFQKDFLNNFREKMGSPTYKEMSKMTGIHYVRIFRIFHGYTMRIDEFLNMQKLLKGENKLNELIDDCYLYLNSTELADIENFIVRRLALKRILSD